MWTFSSPSLPATATPIAPADLCVINTGASLPPVAVVDYQSQWQSPELIRVWEPVTVSYPVTGNTIAIPTSANLVHLDLVTVGGISFTPALDPENPQPGEYTVTTAEPEDFDELTPSLPITSITIYPSTPLSVATATITGGQRTEATPTNVLPLKLPRILRGLPVTGQMTWSLTLEQHPSGSLELLCQGETIASIRSRFKKGTEFEMFGIGFSIANYQEALEPYRLYRVTLSLTGKWARPKYNRPSFLRPQSQGLANAVPIVPIQQPRRTTVTELAKQIGVPFVPLEPETAWQIRIEPDTPKEAAQVWSSGLQSLARPCNGYVDWTNPSQVLIRSLDPKQRKRWSYSVNELTAAYQGDCEHSSDHRGYAAEYPNVELTGEFLDRLNRIQEPRPNWTRQAPEMVTLRSGDTDAHQVPANVRVLRNLSLNWDSSGPTKTLRINTTIDGQPFKSTEVIYGFCYTGRQVFNQSKGELEGSPSLYWQIVSFKEQTWIYDSRYGYPLGYDVNGWRMSRFQQESEQMETLSYDPGDAIDGRFYNLYVFKKTPILERNRELLQTFSSVYLDAQEQPAWVSYTYINPDGSEQTRYVVDPTWAPSMFSRQSLTYVGSFAKTANPDFDPEEQYDFSNPPPPKFLITGEESLAERSLTLRPGRLKTIVNTRTGTRFEQDTPDLYTERSLEDSAQNAGFQDKAIRDAFTDYSGRPSAASRKPSTLEREQPEANDAKPPPQPKRYTLTTPGYDKDDPIEGSVSYSNAVRLDEAITAAKADLLLRDIQESIQYTLQIPFNAGIRPLDRLDINAQGERYTLAVTTVSQTVQIQGELNGQPFLTVEPTQVTAGIDRAIPVEVHESRVPRPIEDLSDRTPNDPSVRLTLGNLFDTAIQGRGNY